MAKNLFERLDRNQDGKLSREEFHLIAQELENYLKLKVQEDEKRVKELRQEITTNQESAEDLATKFKIDPNNEKLKADNSFGVAELVVFCNQLAADLQLNYSVNNKDSIVVLRKSDRFNDR